MGEEGRTVAIDAREVEDEAATQSTITRDQMDDALGDLGEVLDRQPGMRMSRLGGLGSYTSASVRGSTAEQVLVLLDGVPLVSTAGGPIDLAMLPLGLLRRVTITRGSSPAAFGVSAIGGVVDIRLREPLGPVVELEAGGGSFDTRMARTYLGLGDGEQGGGLGIDYQGSAGDFPYSHGGGTAWEAEDDALTTRQNNHFDQLTTLARGRLTLSESVSLSLVDVVSWHRRAIPGIALYSGTGADLETLRHTLGGTLHVDLGWTPGATFDLIPWTTWSASTLEVEDGGLSLGGSSTESTSNALGTRVNLSVPALLDAEGAWTLVSNTTLAYRREAYEGMGVVDNPAQAERHRLAACAEFRLHSTLLNTTLVTSGRFEAAWTQSDEGEHDEALEGSGRVGLAYEAIPGTLVTLNLSQGARFPTPFELFGFTAMTRGNASLAPEHGMNIDGGVRHEARWLPEGSYGALEVTGFASLSDDLIQFVRNSQGVSRPENVASALIAGVEFGLWFDVLSHVRLRTSLTWMHSEDRSDIVARQGKKLPYRPTWKSYGRLEGYGHLPGAGEAGLALDVEHISGDVLDHANLIENPARILLGLGAWIEFLEGQFRVKLNIRNIADAKVLDFQGYPLPGPTAMATLRWTPGLD